MPKAARARKRQSSGPAAADVAAMGLLPSDILTSGETLESLLRAVEVPDADFVLRSTSEEVREYLRDLARTVNAKGGWLEVSATRQWTDITAPNGRNAKDDYEMIWFPVVKWHDFQRKYGKNRPFGLKPTLIRPESIVQAPIITQPATGRLETAFWDKLFAQEIAVFRGFFLDVWPLDLSMLSISHLEANHSDLIIDITRQAKHPHMFPMKSHSFVSQRSSLGEFLQRMKEGEDAETYMASVDVAGWKTLVNAMLRFVPEKLCFGSQEDALEYSRIHVSGVTLPQLTVSLRDSWTGVKQVELCLRLVDLNSGPGKREWWAVSKDEWERAKLDGKAAGWNPQEDGSYWPDEHFLMSKGYRIFYVQQCPGDMLVLSPAMYYWTRSLSPTVSVGWCICPKTISQFSACFQRDFMNRSACQESQVHIYTLAMDLLNREMDELPKDLVRFVGEKLAVRFEEEQRMVERGKLPNVGVFPKHQVRRCEKCRLELFFAYASCVECANAVCLKCARKHSHKVASCCNMFLSSRFQHFQERVSSRCDDSLSEDLFDPALNLHFTVSEKYRDALACVSPYSGSPNCMLFTTKLPAQSPPDPIAEPPVTKSPKISENSNLDQYIIPKKPRNYLVRP